MMSNTAAKYIDAGSPGHLHHQRTQASLTVSKTAEGLPLRR
jgi:hypothetical protein